MRCVSAIFSARMTISAWTVVRPRGDLGMLVKLERRCLQESALNYRELISTPLKAYSRMTSPFRAYFERSIQVLKQNSAKGKPTLSLTPSIDMILTTRSPSIPSSTERKPFAKPATGAPSILALGLSEPQPEHQRLRDRVRW